MLGQALMSLIYLSEDKSDAVCVRTRVRVCLNVGAGDDELDLLNRVSRILNLHTYMHACIDAYTHTHIHTHMHACIHTYIHTHIHTHTHACMHTYIHTHMHACMHTYIHTHIHTHMHACMLLTCVS